MQIKAVTIFSLLPLEGQTLAEEYEHRCMQCQAQARRNGCFKKRALQELHIQGFWQQKHTTEEQSERIHHTVSLLSVRCQEIASCPVIYGVPHQRLFSTAWNRALPPSCSELALDHHPPCSGTPIWQGQKQLWSSSQGLEAINQAVYKPVWVYVNAHAQIAN